MVAQRGFTYLGLLFAVAFLGLMLAGTGQVWQLVAKREKEEQLLFVGREFARALTSYRAASPPGQAPAGPRRLGDLVEDRRGGFPGRRHLRRIYTDPISGEADWGLIVIGVEIVGIYSRGSGIPLRQAGFRAGEEAFANARRYAQWIFTARNLEAAESSPGQGGAGGAASPPVNQIASPVISANPLGNQPPLENIPGREPGESDYCAYATFEMQRHCAESRGQKIVARQQCWMATQVRERACQ